MLIPVAHAGHWILYLGPVLVVLAAVLVSAVRERRVREEGEGPEPSTSVDDD